MTGPIKDKSYSLVTLCKKQKSFGDYDAASLVCSNNVQIGIRYIVAGVYKSMYREEKPIKTSPLNRTSMLASVNQNTGGVVLCSGRGTISLVSVELASAIFVLWTTET